MMWSRIIITVVRSEWDSSSSFSPDLLMLIMGRELSETGVRCEKSYWKSSQPVKIWQNNIVVVTKIVFVGHPTKKYSTYPNLSQLFRHFHGFIKGSPCPHRTAPRDPWHLGYNANRSKSVSRSSPHTQCGAGGGKSWAMGKRIKPGGIGGTKTAGFSDSRNHVYVEPHSR